MLLCLRARSRGLLLRQVAVVAVEQNQVGYTYCPHAVEHTVVVDIHPNVAAALAVMVVCIAVEETPNLVVVAAVAMVVLAAATHSMAQVRIQSLLAR